MTAPAPTQKLTASGDLHTITVGQIRLSAQLTVDGGVTLTIWQGPSRHDAVTFEYADKVLGRRVYASLRQMAATGMSAAQIADTMHSNRDHALTQVREILEDAEGEASARDRIRLAHAISAEIQGLKSDAEWAADEALVADMRTHLGLDCAADGPDDAPTGIPMTSAPSPTDTPAQTLDKPRNVVQAYGTRTPNRVRITAPLTPDMRDMHNELRATGRIDLTTANGHVHRTAKGLIERGYATPIKRTNAKPGQRTLTAITLPDGVRTEAAR